MATKKKSTSVKSKANSKSAPKSQGKGALASFILFVKSQRFAHIRGSFYVLFAVFLVISMTAYYATGCDPHHHWLGYLGYGVAHFFATHLFGIGSIGFGLLFFVYGMRLWNVQVMPWWRTFGVTLFWMFWLSLTLGYIGGAWVKSASGFDHFAGIGIQMAEPLHHLMRWWTLVVLIFVAVLFLVLVHHLEMPRMPKVNLKKTLHEIEEVMSEDGKQPRQQPSPSPLADTLPPALERADKEDEGADFDEEAMKLFHEPAHIEEDNEEDDDIETLTTVGTIEKENGEVGFSIDDEFDRINSRARGEQDEEGNDGISFTIESGEWTDENDPSTNPKTNEDEVEKGEDLASDDYRRHYGIDDPFDPHLELSDYIKPDTDLLENWEVANTNVTKEELIANKDRIVQTLSDYGIEITEISAIPGPTVTLYKIKPAPGVRISKIKGLENDIALSLAALGIRIIAPIPGESNVGIEVPNAKPQIVAMKTMLESEAFVKAKEKMELPIAFGKTISNECFVTDLAKMPHLLMAGATGTGKSVGLNAVLASLLYTKHPSELKLVLVDPKKVEFSLYSALDRHFLAKMPDEEEAVITDVKKVVRTLNSLCIEMDSRYDLLKQAQVRKISEYNDKFCKRMLNPEHGHRYLPYIVVVIDEFGDLIMTAGKEVELPIARLAQLARAVGIHLIIATQRPTTNIITGTIKANFPARVAFRVTSGIDSKTILDTGGAQQLIGRGDMLISLAGKDMVRLQCALIDTPEIEKLVRFIGDQRGYPEGFELPEYLDENEEPNKEFDAKSKDEFFNDAARLVVSSQFGSTSLLQRKLQLGYNRAGRIIDQLEAAGIVGPSNGSKPRDVLIHDEMTLEELLRNL